MASEQRRKVALPTRDKDLIAALHAGVTSDVQAQSFVKGCAHRDQQVIAFLRGPGRELWLNAGAIASAIERGEHVK